MKHRLAAAVMVAPLALGLSAVAVVATAVPANAGTNIHYDPGGTPPPQCHWIQGYPGGPWYRICLW